LRLDRAIRIGIFELIRAIVQSSVIAQGLSFRAPLRSIER
jgi:hypothetical protein